MTPIWLETARKYIGTKEIPGASHSTVILAWAQYLGGWVKSFFTSDEIPWCGLAAGALFKSCGYTIPKNPLSALSWASWGQKMPKPTIGAVLVFKRPEGGHVGLYEGEDKACYHVLGGNQGNMVKISRIEKARCVAVRWPPGELLPPAVPLWLTPSGEISKNEG